MAIREIVIADELAIDGGRESILRKECTKVNVFSEELLKIVQDLRDTMHSDKLSVGLAAPQIGYNWAVAVVNLNKKQDEDLILINPKIVSESGSWDSKYESCMSVPHKKGQVKRRKKAHIEYRDTNGKRKELHATSFLARVIMHEIDHLNGSLYVDRMDKGSSIEETNLFREHGIN